MRQVIDKKKNYKIKSIFFNILLKINTQSMKPLKYEVKYITSSFKIQYRITINLIIKFFVVLYKKK